MTKEKLKRHFRSFWFVYLVWISLSVFITQWIVGVVVAPSKAEKISLFIGNPSMDVSSVVDSAKQVEMPTISEVETHVVQDGDYLTVYADVYLQKRTDIALLSKADADKLTKSFGALFFEIDTVCELQDDDNVYYEVDGKKLGIKLDGFVTSKSDEVYFLFINRQSIHIGLYNSDSVDTYAIDVAKQLLKGEK